MSNIRTPEDFDAVSDDAFHDLAHSAAESTISLTDDQRQSMRDAYAGMVEASDPDVRENFEPVEAMSDWFLYATLRMNGVSYATTGAPRP